jgi:putative hemolysin
MTLLTSTIILIVLTFLSGYFSASETALFSLSSIKIKSYRSSSDKRKNLIANLVLKPRDLLVTVFMLNTLVNILLQNVASDMFGSAASWALKVGVPLFLMLVFGEIIPKYIGIQNNVTISEWVAPSINFIQNLLSPIRKWTIAITLPVSRFMFFFLKKEESISKEELQHVLRQSEEQGVLPPDEAELVWGYLNLQNATVKELMQPREDILAYDFHEPLSKLTYLFVDQQCSRIPVCDEKIDNVIGIVSAKQYFLNLNQFKTGEDILSIIEKPLFVPEAIKASILLKRLDEQNQEIALVVNEYGALTGLVAYEDMIEVVVGKITDLRDQRMIYTKSGESEIIASGKLELSEFNEIFSSSLVSPNNMITIGGWLTEYLGEIPKTGTKVETNGFLFHILAADPNRVRRLYIRKISSNKNTIKRG